MSRIITLSSALLLFVTVGGGPLEVGAQITGEVTDSAGTPIGEVLVEAWSEAEGRIASRLTGEDGLFEFPEAVVQRATILRASRLGYRLLTRPLDEGTDHYLLRLAEEPISLEGFVVNSEGESCEEADSKFARELWNAVRQRYAGPMDTLGIATYLSTAESLVEPGEIGPLDVPTHMSEQQGSSSQLRFSWTRRVRRSGYAFRVRRTDFGRSYDSWSYAPLEAGFAPHFVDELFGEAHRFQVLHSGNDGWTLEFCPRDPDRPSIRGTMRIGADTTLVTVEWLFQTEKPDEKAGGRAFYPPLATSAPPEETWPLPTESIFWRQLPTGRFQEVHRRFEGWIVAQGDTVPFLPPRGR